MHEIFYVCHCSEAFYLKTNICYNQTSGDNVFQSTNPTLSSAYEKSLRLPPACSQSEVSAFICSTSNRRWITLIVENKPLMTLAYYIQPVMWDQLISEPVSNLSFHFLLSSPD